MASSCWWMVCHQWLGRHFHPFFSDLDHYSNHLLQPSCSITFSRWCKVPHRQLGWLFHPFFLTWCDKQSFQARLRPSNRGRWFHVWRLFIRQAHGFDNQWNLALMEAGVVSKMQTPAIPGVIFQVDLYVFDVHTQIPNGTHKLHHVKRSAIFQDKPFAIPYGRMNHFHHHWNKCMLTIIKNAFYSRCARWLPLVDE